MTAQDLRRAYIDFFVSKGHVPIPSASLVPENDPSVLFTTAGMHPLVPYLMGEPHPSGTRLVNVQKCIRTGDIDEVGDNTHLTFFEMLGNWSLGDYFKPESIAWSFEFLTRTLQIPLEKLAFSVFAGDTDVAFDQVSYDAWIALGVPDARIARLGKEDNWWPAGGKHPGPQGPDTEIFYWTGTEEAPATFDASNTLWVEIWNNVFMQFDRSPEGLYTPLPATNVDTGMGLERTLAVLTGKANVFETDLFVPIIAAIESSTQTTYTAHEGTMRIIADHVRTAVMMVSDAVKPSNKDQGYILRRLIRRAVRQMNVLAEDVRLASVVDACLATLTEAYPLLHTLQDTIRQEIASEEQKFQLSLKKGLREFEKMYAAGGTVGGAEAFTLYATYGFPLELTEELVREAGHAVDRVAFQSEFAKHQELSRAGAAGKFAGGLADHSDQSRQLHTATHLLHKALRFVLGEGVTQRGSNITQERLRFDFSYPDKLTDAQKQQVEDLVNQQIQANLPMDFEIMTVEEAKRVGAIGLFEDKYALIGDKIKVYSAGNVQTGVFSREICGGPHADNTGALGAFAILKEESSSAGIRRIKAIIGPKAQETLNARI